MNHRRVLVVTGSRAEFGLLSSTLDALHAHSAIECSLVVAGSHLIGTEPTVREIESRYAIDGMVEMQLDSEPRSRVSDGFHWPEVSKASPLCSLVTNPTSCSSLVTESRSSRRPVRLRFSASGWLTFMEVMWPSVSPMIRCVMRPPSCLIFILPPPDSVPTGFSRWGSAPTPSSSWVHLRSMDWIRSHH